MAEKVSRNTFGIEVTLEMGASCCSESRGQSKSEVQLESPLRRQSQVTKERQPLLGVQTDKEPHG